MYIYVLKVTFSKEMEIFLVLFIDNLPFKKECNFNTSHPHTSKVNATPFVHLIINYYYSREKNAKPIVYVYVHYLDRYESTGAFIFCKKIHKYRKRMHKYRKRRNQINTSCLYISPIITFIRLSCHLLESCQSVNS